MDSTKRVEKLRNEYERALARSEARGPAAGERLAKGSTITLYIVMGRSSAKKPTAHS